MAAEDVGIPKDPGRGMTWGRGAPALALAAIFDGFRAFFDLFWLFGPLLLGVIAKVGTSSVVTSALSSAQVGSETAVAAGNTLGNVAGAVTTIAGVALTGPMLAVFGTIMAMTIGLVGWLAEFFTLKALDIDLFSPKNGRIFWSLGSLLISEVPIVDAIPTLTPWTFMALRTKIKEDRKKREEYEEAMRTVAQRRQAQRSLFLAQRRAELEAADEQNALESANDNSEAAIPEEMARAA